MCCLEHLIILWLISKILILIFLGSDMGYYSNYGFSSPPSLPNYKPAWSRFSSLSIDGPSLEEKKPGHWDQTDADDESDAKPNRDPR